MSYYIFKDNELGKISEKKDSIKKATFAVAVYSVLAFLLYIILIKLTLELHPAVFSSILVLLVLFTILVLRQRKITVANDVSEKEKILCSLAYGIRDLQDYASQRKDESFDAAKKSLATALKLLKNAEIDGIGTKWEKDYNLFLDALSQTLSVLIKTKLRKGVSHTELNPLIKDLVEIFEAIETDNLDALSKKSSSGKKEDVSFFKSKWGTKLKEFSATIGILVFLGLVGVLSYYIGIVYFYESSFNLSLAVTFFFGTPTSLVAVWSFLQNLREKFSKPRKGENKE